MNVISSVPTIDGHLWVKRNGVDIDPHFNEYDMISYIQTGKKAPQKWIRKPAEDIIQKVIIGIYERNIKTEYSTMEEFVVDYLKIMGKDHKPVFGKCITNALIERHLNGGELVFGSCGFPKGNSIWWEFGGADWTVKQFLKK